MVDTILSYFIIGSSLTFIGQLAVWVVCLLLLIRERNWASVFLFSGSTLVSLSSIAGIFIEAVIAGNSTPEVLLQYKGIMYIIDALFYLVFAIGIVLFVLQYFRVHRFINRTSEL